MKKKLIIVSLIISSLLFSEFLIEEVFIANTPRIYPNLAERLTGKATNFIARINPFNRTSSPNNTSISQSIAAISPMKTNEEIANLTKDLSSFSTVSKGVYAKETSDGASYTVIKQDEVEWLEYTFNVDGKTIKIRVPKGQNPPSQTMMEKIYK